MQIPINKLKESLETLTTSGKTAGTGITFLDGNDESKKKMAENQSKIKKANLPMWIITPNDDAAKQAILDKMKDRMAEINNTIPPSFPIVFYGDNNNAQTVTWGEHGETRFTHIVDEMYKPVKKMIEKYFISF